MAQTEKPKSDKEGGAYLKWLGIGVEFCGVLGVFCYIGYKIDEHFGTSPLYFIVSFFFAFIGMFYLMLKQTMNIWRK
jgi:F0F1-type ATP synthase assembly protein I